MRWIVAMQSKIKVSIDKSGEDAIPLLGESPKAPAIERRREDFFEAGDGIGTVWAIAAFEHADEDFLVGLAEKARRLFTPATPGNPDIFGLGARLVGDEHGITLLNGYRASMNHGEGTSCAPRDFLIASPVEKARALRLLEGLSSALPMALAMLGETHGAKLVGDWGVWVEGADSFGRSPGGEIPPPRIGGFEPALELASHASSMFGEQSEADALIEKLLALRLREALDEETGQARSPSARKPGI